VVHVILVRGGNEFPGVPGGVGCRNAEGPQQPVFAVGAVVGQGLAGPFAGAQHSPTRVAEVISVVGLALAGAGGEAGAGVLGLDAVAEPVRAPRRARLPCARHRQSLHLALHRIAELSRIRSRRLLRRRWLGTSGGLWPWEARPPRAEPQRRDSQINTAHSAYRPGSVLLAAPFRSVPAHSDQTPGQYTPRGCPPAVRPFTVAPSTTWADDRRRCKAPTRLPTDCGTPAVRRQGRL
jgi:hypothetical protein